MGFSSFGHFLHIGRESNTQQRVSIFNIRFLPVASFIREYLRVRIFLTSLYMVENGEENL